MRRESWQSLKKAGGAAGWIAAAGGVFVVVFTISFYLAMKMEMRSTEAVVPDMVGLTQEEADRLAAPLGLWVEVADQRNDPAVSSGRILAQQPVAGSEVRRGRRVKIVLSLGGKVLEVPDLVGQRARTVEITLRRGGFVPGDEIGVFDPDAELGTVIAQVPSPGSASVPGERVHRLVSLGPPDRTWVMPDLTERERGEVQRWLEKAGFRIGPVRQVANTGRSAGTVVGQLPAAGHPVRSRDVVHLRVAR
jgi:beta-lactam-binding protein with PASTA domain